MLVPHFAGCYTTLRRSRPKHHRPDLFAPRHTNMPVLLPASRSASSSIAPRAASTSLGTAFAPSVWCFRPAGSYAPGHTFVNRIPPTRGQVCWSCPLPVAPQLCRGADPSLNNQTCSLRATPACCTCASLELRILLATLREQPVHDSVSSQHLLFWCFRRAHGSGQASTSVPSQDSGFQHHLQARRVQAPHVLGRQLGEQPAKRGVNFIVYHNDVQRLRELQGEHARVNGSVNDGS